MSKIRILISTDSAAIHSGLAETCRNIFIPLLQRYPDKYEIEQLGFFHFTPKEPVPWPIHRTIVNNTPNGPQPDDSDRYGQKTFPELVKRIKPDIVFGYGDMWHFQHLIESPLRNTYRLVVNYTIDGTPYYGDLHEDESSTWGRYLSKCDEVVVLSYFGRHVLKNSCPELKDKEIRVAYHPLDMRQHRIYSPQEIQQIRSTQLPKIFGDDLFIAGWCGRNQFRKQNYKLWEVTHYMVHGDYIRCKTCGRVTVKEWDPAARASQTTENLTLYDPGYEYDHCWHCKSPNIIPGTPNPKYYLWLHMARTDAGYNCDMHERMWRIGNNIIQTGGLHGTAGISKPDLLKAMSVWDVMFYPSGGEGFGNPAFECMASGTPILFSNYSSHAEFSKFGGLPIRIANYTPELHLSIFRSAVDTNHAVEQMLKLVENPELKRNLGIAARQHAAQFAIPHITPVWDHIFTEMMKKPLPIARNEMYSTAI